MQSSPVWRTALALGPVVWAANAAAQTQVSAAEPFHVAYSAYAAGFNVVELDAGLAFDPHSYRVELNFRTAGTFGALFHAQTQSIVAGSWAGDSVEPARFYSYGTLRGVPRRTLIDYAEGQPSIRILEPPPEAERDPVPPAMAKNTVDTLSALALLVHQVARTGRCDGHVTTFDGRRVSDISVTDGGTEVLEPESRSNFSGPAHRCNFEGRQIAGFVRDVDPNELRRPQHGAAWLAPVAGAPAPIPVRMTFHTRFFGDATMYLTAAGPGGATQGP